MVLEDNAGILYKLSYMYTNTKEEAEDLYQEITYQIIKSYGRFKGDSKTSTWVYKVALFTSLAYLRRSRKRVKLIYDLPEIVNEESDDHWTEVMVAIKKLSPIERSLIFLYLEEKSYKEIAEILELTESNVGVRLNRIRKKLRIALNG